MLVRLGFSDGMLALEYAGQRFTRVFSARDGERLDALSRAFDDAHGAGHERVLPQCGRALSEWLDGEGGWLARVLAASTDAVDLCVDAGGEDPGRATALLAAPWELLWTRDTYLANDERFGVVRRAQRGASERPPLPGPLNLLFAAPAPEDLPLLDYEAEYAAIRDATDGLPISLRFDDSGTLRDLSDAVRPAQTDRPLDVLHLACHAVARPRPSLMFEDAVGLTMEVDPRAFVDMLGDAAPGLGLLTLSSCLTANAPGGPGQPLALDLVSAGVRAVLGWTNRVSDALAATFSAELYRCLAARSHSLIRAVAAARRALLRDPRRGSEAWSMARLFMASAPDGPLIVSSAAPTADFILDPEPLLGRRGEVRRLVAALRGPHRLVLLHGLGGVGKTALADAALTRMGADARVVDLKDGAVTALRELLDTARPLPQIVALDGFEAVLEPTPGRLHRLHPDARSALEGLVQRVLMNASTTLLVISRVDFCGLGHNQQPGSPWQRLPLAALAERPVEKWLRRSSLPVGLADPRALLGRTAFAAAQHPALLRWALATALRDPEGWAHQLDAIEANDYSALTPVLVDLGIPAVIEQLTAVELALLLDVLTFDTPLPRSCLVELCHHLAVDPAAIDRLCGLGAWSEVPDPLDPEHLACVRTQIVVDYLLADRHVAPDDDRAREVAASVLPSLHAYWSELVRGAHLERFRMAHQLAELALLVGDAGVATQGLLWARQWRPPEDALRLSSELLALLGARGAADPCSFLFVCAELHQHGATAEQRSRLVAAIEEALEGASLDADADAPGLFQELAHYLAMRDEHPRAIELLEQASSALARRGAIREAAILRSEALEMTADLGDLQAAQDGLERDVLPVFHELGLLGEYASALCKLAEIALEQERLDDAWELADRAIAAYERLGLWERWVAAHRIQLDVHMTRGDADAALRLCREKIQPVCDGLAGDDWLLGAGWSLIHILSHVGALAEAERLLADRIVPAVMRRDRVDDQLQAWLHLADLVEERGQLARSFELLAGEVRPRYTMLGDQLGAVLVDFRCARLLIFLGQIERASGICAANLAWVESVDNPVALAELHGVLASIAEAQGQLDRALEIRRTREIPLFEQLEDERSIAVAQGHVADLLDDLGRHEEALMIRLTLELPVYAKAGDERAQAVALSALARTRIQLGQVAEAERLLRDEVLPVFVRLAEARETSIAMMRLADALSTQGQRDEARTLVEQQIPTFERLADHAQVVHARRRISEYGRSA